VRRARGHTHRQAHTELDTLAGAAHPHTSTVAGGITLPSPRAPEGTTTYGVTDPGP